MNSNPGHRHHLKGRQEGIYYTSRHTELHVLDLLLEEVVGIKRTGHCLDIVAYDVVINSKTFHQSDLGWEGVYVEPIAEFAAKCANRHQNNQVIIEQVAIGTHDHTGIIYKDGLASTLQKEQKDFQEAVASRHDELNFQFRKEKVSIWSWDTLYKKHLQNRSFDLFVMDVEGSEMNVLQQIDFSAFRPAIIICEIFRQQWDFVSEQMIIAGKQVEQTLKNQGYYPWLIDAHNTAFVPDRPTATLLNQGTPIELMRPVARQHHELGEVEEALHVMLEIEGRNKADISDLSFIADLYARLQQFDKAYDYQSKVVKESHEKLDQRKLVMLEKALKQQKGL